MKVVRIPRGSTEQEDAITGYEGQLRGDLSRGEIRFHDGIRQGGHRILNEDGVKSLIASGLEQAGSGTVQFFSSNELLAAATPSPTTLAIVSADGFEEAFIWDANADVIGDGIVSDIDGHWKRVNNKVGFYIRLKQAGLITLQINGVEPASNQDTTAWLDSGTVKLWDGADYLAATPTLFARLLAKIGNYYVGAFSLPDRLAATLVEIADCDDIDESGWYKTAAAATNAPIAGAHLIEHRRISSTLEMQVVWSQGSTTLTKYVRWKNTTWGSWISADDVLPNRLAATSGTVTDADSATESGFYQLNAAASNIPAAEKGTLQVVRYSSTAMTQLWKSTDSNKLYTRQMLASAWSAWAEVGAALGLAALATILQGASADSTPLDADNIWFYDAVDGTIKKVTLTQLWDNYLKGELDSGLTALANLADASGVLTNNGSGGLSWVAAAAAVDSYDAVGSYMLAGIGTGLTVNTNSTVSGSSIKPANVLLTVGNVNNMTVSYSGSMSGTWRCHGYLSGGNGNTTASLFIRTV